MNARARIAAIFGRSGNRRGRLIAACALGLLACAGTGAPSALATPPSVVSVKAVEVGFTSAKAEGEVNPGEKETSYHFEYVSQAQFEGSGWAEATQIGFGSLAEGINTPTAVEAVNLEGLAAGTTYRLRLIAENSDGGGSAQSSFETQVATAPAVTIQGPSEVEASKVHLEGTVNPGGGNVNPVGPTVLPIAWEFQINREGEGWEFAAGGVIAEAEAESSAAITVKADLTNLKPASHYEVRLRAFRADAEAVSVEPPFTTLTVSPPSVTINAADSVTATDAHLSGEVTAGGTDPLFDAKCTFLLVTEARFQAEGFAEKAFKDDTERIKAEEEGYVPPRKAACEPGTVKGASSVAVEAAATGLEPNQTYHLRLSATNAGGTTTDGAPTFTTAAAAPSVRTIYADHIAATSATLRGWVNPRRSATTYYFLWGSEDCSANPCQSMPLSEDAPAGSGNAVVSAQQSLTGLEPETTYHYLLVAENQAGTSEGEDRTFTTAAESDPNCPNEARRAEEPLSFVLADCRAWELASPGASADVMADTARTVAAASESPGLPMAVKFSSLVGFGDVHGSGGAGFDYLAQRDGEPGTSGWAIQGIIPPQEQLPYNAPTSGIAPLYETFTPDLTRGLFRSWSSLTDAPHVAEVPNLYTRDDLRASGPGTYQLLSDSETQQAPITIGKEKPWFAGASPNLEHVLYESRLNLTSDATGNNPKLYKSDDGVVRLVKASAACAGRPGGEGAPCSIAGIGATPYDGLTFPHYTLRVISDDGSLVNFTSPFGDESTSLPNSTPGVVSKLFQLDDRGTPASDDDAVIPLSMSEKASPDVAKVAIYDTASTDGNRVFFHSEEQLTDAPGSGLYMWERKSTDEKQSLEVDATGGSFTLTAHTQPSWGAGTLANGSSEVSGVTGSFTVGQAIAGNGIEPGTTVTAVDPGGTAITLSAPATVDGQESLSASIEATTNPISWHANAAQVQVELEGLSMIGAGNVAVTGGPGGSAPFTIEFIGALAGVDVMQLTSDESGLSGGGFSASVTTTDNVHNLTLIGPGGGGVFGASEDGHRVYFAKGVGHAVGDVWYWQDADGTPGGSFSQIATLGLKDNRIGQFPNPETYWTSVVTPLARVTPDGRSLLFAASDGAGIVPGYQHGKCPRSPIASPNKLCTELYVFRADSSTPGHPDIVCASCNLEVPGASNPGKGNAFTNVREGVGVAGGTAHLNRSLSTDGRYVFFDTAQPLVPEDTNGTIDAYEYDVKSGEVHLLSSGTDPADSYFLDASADGSDAFIVTRQPLSRWDDDRAYDVYDVRAGGGFPEPPPPPAICTGDSCHTGAPPPPPATSPGSSTLVQGRKPCPRGTRQVRRKSQVRCAKVRRHHKRTANKNRRAGR